MARVFICYRRERAGYAGRLWDRLTAEFGDEAVFMDVGAIPPGEDFVQAIGRALDDVAVLLVVIGPNWLSLRKEDGTRLIDDPSDFVRIEVATALRREIHVIPILVGGASMPSSSDLPEDLSGLARKQAVELSHAEFDASARSLYLPIRELLGGRHQQRPAGLRWLIALSVVQVALWLLLYGSVAGIAEQLMGCCFVSFPVISIALLALGWRRSVVAASAQGVVGLVLIVLALFAGLVLWERFLQFSAAILFVLSFFAVRGAQLRIHQLRRVADQRRRFRQLSQKKAGSS